MRLIIRDDSHAASSYVANYIVDRIKHFNPTADRPFVLGLPTGSSPLGVYKILVEKYKAGEVRRSMNKNLTVLVSMVSLTRPSAGLIPKCRDIQHGVSVSSHECSEDLGPGVSAPSNDERRSSWWRCCPGPPVLASFHLWCGFVVPSFI